MTHPDLTTPTPEPPGSTQLSKPREPRQYKATGFKTIPSKLPKKRGLVWRSIQVLFGSFLMALSINLFIDPAGLLPAGFVGLALLIQRIVLDQTGLLIPYAVLNIGLNLIPAIYAFFHIGKNFFSLSVLSIIFSSFLIDIIPIIPVTDEIVLSMIFAGVLSGIGLSIVLNADACAGGTDFIAVAISNKKHTSIWNQVMIFNFVVLGISAVYFDVDLALYSIVFQFITTQVITRSHMRYQRRTCFVVTSKPEPLAKELMKITRHGITTFRGTGAYSGHEQYMLYMVVNRSDVRRIKRYLRDHAPGTFFNVTDSEQLGGNFFVEPMD